MRKITSKKKSEKKVQRNQMIGGIILTIIMIFSVLGYSLMSGSRDKSETIIYKGIEFIKDSNLWKMKLGEMTFSFLYNPEEVEEIDSKINLIDDYAGKPLYISSENSEAENEIYRNLFYENQVVQRVQYACLEGQTCEENLPIKNCEDNFIIIKESNETQVEQMDNCIYIKGKSEDLGKLADSFLYKMMGLQ